MRILRKENKRTRFTRRCIGEAVIALLAKEDLKHVKVQAVVKKAGVSRMTFYKYYTSIQAVLEDYLGSVIMEYIEELGRQENGYDFLRYEHILFALRFFDRYRDFFLTMKKRGLYAMLIDRVNAFMQEYLPTDNALSVYKQYSYAGGLLNTFLMWEENGRKERAEDVAGMIHQLYGI